jgi:tetratricopeptide (TPR) repeat protein
MKTPANSPEELKARQNLWRQAIAPLELVNPNSELYRLISPRLLRYRANLKTVNQQILAEEKWLKKLVDAKAVAGVAARRETNAKSLKDWQKVQSTWQIVVNALNVIPQTSPGYQEAQQLLLEYKPKLARARDRVTIEELGAKSYQQLISIAKQAKAYEQQQQWQAAVIYWEQALQAAKQVSNDSLYYNQAQSAIAPYSASLKQAQEKLQLNNAWQQTRTDLNKTCSSGIRICNFTVDEKGINVKITPEYEQMLQSGISEATTNNTSTIVDVTNHWESLQEALTVISENANLPLFIYNTENQAIYIRTPQN